MRRHLLVIGAQRSGSTYLHSLLDGHPQITMARPVRPEPKVFLSDEVLGRDRQWYVDTYFAHATTEVLLGEKSTSYIEDSQAATRAERVLGSVEVVAILRDPVVRAVSNWRFSTENGLETRPLEAALRENLAGTRSWDNASTSVSPFAYLERGRFDGYLDAWFQIFGPRVRVVFLQELLSSPQVLHDLSQSLDIEPFGRQAGAREPVNASSQPAPDLPADLLGQLREYYETSDRALAARLGRDLPWRTKS